MSDAIALQVKGPVMPVPVQHDERAVVFSMIERLARDPAVDIDKLERIMALQRQMTLDRAEMEYAEAMSACQNEMEPIRKDAENKQTKSNYATYHALDRALRPIYTKHGFEVTFDTADASQPDHILILCMITHKGGHKRIHRAPMACDGKGAKGGDVMTKTHAMGSALMYGRRYTLGLGFNIVTADMKDDDGNAAGAGETISDEQRDELLKLMDDFESAQIEGFCTYFKIKNIGELLAKDFERAKAAIAKSKAKRAS